MSRLRKSCCADAEANFLSEDSTKIISDLSRPVVWAEVMRRGGAGFPAAGSTGACVCCGAGMTIGLT